MCSRLLACASCRAALAANAVAFCLFLGCRVKLHRRSAVDALHLQMEVYVLEQRRMDSCCRNASVNLQMPYANASSREGQRFARNCTSLQRHKTNTANGNYVTHQLKVEVMLSAHAKAWKATISHGKSLEVMQSHGKSLEVT